MASVAATSPSGVQVELAHRDQHLVLTEVGAGLRTYAVGDRHVLDGYGVGEMSSGGRGQPLLPWPNRIAGGRYTFAGSELQLPLNEPERGNAIHGLTRWAGWEILAQETGRAVLGHLLHPQPGYPFTLELMIEYVLSAAGLAVRTTATNVGTAALPFGAGFHPYFSVGTDEVDDAVLQAPAAAWRETDHRGIPTGAVRSVEGTDLDFRSPRPVGPAVIDTCLTDLQPDGDGLTRVSLSDPDGDATVTVWADRAYGELVLFTGDTLEPPRRRRGLAIEPMTCPPNAFRSGTGLVVLEPGQSFDARWGIAPW